MAFFNYFFSSESNNVSCVVCDFLFTFATTFFRKPTSKFEALRHMKKIGKGEHESSDLCQTFSCVAYRLFHYNEAQYGDIDTTSIKYTSIQAHIVPCAINVYGGKPFSGCLL